MSYLKIEYQVESAYRIVMRVRPLWLRGVLCMDVQVVPSGRTIYGSIFLLGASM